MHLARHVLDHKGGGVVTVEPEATALDAAIRMNQHRIGSLVVVAQAGRNAGAVVGIVTERDMLARVLAPRRDPARTRVEEVMTRNVLACSPSDDLDAIRRLMHERRIRHVPVIEDGVLVGLVSIGDLNGAHADNLAVTVRTLEAYISQG